MPAPDSATVIIFDPHVSSALQAIFLALLVIICIKLYEWVKQKLKE
jgi:hypothetical protein